MGLKTLIKKNLYTFRYFKKKNNKIENQNILVSGASSGIGLGICKALVEKNKVFAIFNNNGENLKKINNPNLISFKCDLSNFDNYNEIEKKLSENDIQIIFNCAGQFGSSNQSIHNLDFENFLKILKINSLSILKILQLMHKYDKIKNIKTVVNISSDGGSVELNNKGNAYIYRTTKSALNSISKNLSIDLKKRFDISVLTIDPGNVKTNMNNKGYLSPSECAEYLIDILCDKIDYNGSFINLLKKKIPW